MITSRPRVPAAAPVRVFVWSAPEDRADCAVLRKHLVPAERGGVLLLRDEDHVPPGENREAALAEEWARAEIVLLLASPDFLAHGCDEAEGLRRALRAGTPVVPLMVWPCDLSLTRLAELQVLPRGGQDLRSLDESARNKTCMEVAAEIVALARRLREGPPLAGRAEARDDMLRAVERGEPVQLLGLSQMGKTRLLTWAADTLRTLGKRPVFFSATGLAGCSAIHLVRTAAELLGLRAEVDAALYRQSAVPCIPEAVAVLPMLAPSVWLIDDAGSLAKRDHGFDKSFFDMLRALGQKQSPDERILWISACENDLYGSFHKTGLTSQFLNHARKVHVGALCERDVLEWLARMRFGPEEAETAWRVTGGCPRAVEWVIEHRGEMGKGENGLAGALGEWMKSLYERWWGALEERERQALKRVAEVGEGTAPEEGIAREEGTLGAEGVEAGVRRGLLDRGLLVETVNGHELAGAAWRAFVRGR